MVQFDESSLWLLGRAADGSMRDALSLTDQAIAFGSGRLGEGDVRQMLGTIDHNSVYRLIEALAASDGAALLGVVADLAEMGADFAGVVSELLVVMHRLAVAQTVPEGLDNSLGDRNKIIELAPKLAAEDVQFYYQIALAGRRDIGLAPDPRSGLEMLLLRMLAFKPQGIIDAPRQSLARPIAAVAEATASVKKPQTPKPAADTPPSESISEGSNSATVVSEQVLSQASDDQTIPNDIEVPNPADVIGAPLGISQQELHSQGPDESQEQAVTSVVAPPVPEPDLSGVAREVMLSANEAFIPSPDRPDAKPPEPAASAPVEQAEKIAFGDLNDTLWREQFDAFQLPGMLGSVASHCQIASLATDSLSFNIDEANAALLNDRHIERLGELLSEYFEKPLKVTVNIGTVAFETPAAYKQRCLDERLVIAKDALRTDSYVARIIQEFDGVLDEESVRLVD